MTKFMDERTGSRPDGSLFCGYSRRARRQATKTPAATLTKKE
jgi:hypothetical protein